LACHSQDVGADSRHILTSLKAPSETGAQNKGKPMKKEWMICQKFDACPFEDNNCRHIKPHLKIGYCCEISARRCPACIVYQLKVGDRVRILSKEGKLEWSIIGVAWKSGDVAIIDNIEDSEVVWLRRPGALGYEPGLFNLSDLEYLPLEETEPKPAQYRWTGIPLATWQVARDSGMISCNLVNLASWAKGFGLDPTENLFTFADRFIAYAVRHFCFRQFLLENGYIEEITENKLEGFFG